MSKRGESVEGSYYVSNGVIISFVLFSNWGEYRLFIFNLLDHEEGVSKRTTITVEVAISLCCFETN
jgi:hypothetical protein